MDVSPFLQSKLFSLGVIPFLIFLARVLDVSLGTIRIISVTRGRKFLASFLGFFEIMVWLMAIGQIMRNLSNPLYYIAFGLGFATGNYVGVFIEEKMALGTVILRLITKQNISELIGFLQSQGYGITTLDGQGATGPVKVMYTLVQRRDLPWLTGTIQRFNPGVFFSVEEVRTASKGTFPGARHSPPSVFTRLFRTWRKGK